MVTTSPSTDRPRYGPREVEPMDPQIRTIQPGSGWVMRGELAFGVLRRWYLRKFRPAYTARMKELRIGVQGNCPFEPVDSRDTKYYQNQGTYRWSKEDDPFCWRDRLPFVRAGLAELIWIGGFFLLLAVGLGMMRWWLSIAPLIVVGLVAWFFRNPHRRIPSAPGQIVSPADGKVVSIEEIEDPHLGSAIQIGIFLSIFNVHVNRASMSGRVIGLNYRPGKFLNALRPESSRENEHLEMRLEQVEAPFRLIKIRQITGAIARRIVCWVAPGDLLKRGEIYGMIKLGSRTELVLPRTADLMIDTKLGEHVKAGTSILARYTADIASDQGE